MKTTLSTIVLALCLCGINGHAQTEIGALISPSASNAHTGTSMASPQYIFPFNYGIKISHTHKRFVFSTGLLHLTQGMKYEIEARNENNVRTGENFDLITRAKAITIPINIDFNFISTSKTNVFAGVGLYTGYIYSQQQENTGFPKYWAPDPNITYPDPPQRFVDVQTFDPLYFGINAGVGIKQQLTDKLSLQARPNFLFQLREELPEASFAWTNRLMTFSLDVGVFYTLRGK
jgi:hypothetical protein